jgi:hypothetical protein
MTISAKTRKILWGRSGNRCAICNRLLVIESTKIDKEAVVGDECHIVSPEDNGPRHDPLFPQIKLDSIDNLILLCKIHHKMIDDQSTTYSTDVLRMIKRNHEIMVTEKLSDDQKVKPVRIRRIKENIPKHLVRISTGNNLVDILSGTYALSIDNDELASENEARLIGGFLQELYDYMDMLTDMEPADRVQAVYDLSNSIKEIESMGFLVFGGKEIQLLEGGNNEPSNWPVGIISVLRKNNESIIKIDLQ